MPYVSSNYLHNSYAPTRSWTCAPSSSLGPFDKPPADSVTKSPDLCGQCVSYVKQVCPALPSTSVWTKGELVKDAKTLAPGTVIATFNDRGKYEGHAAIYVSQGPVGISVYDQYVTPPNPKPVGPRTLRWGAHGNSNNGDRFYVVEP